MAKSNSIPNTLALPEDETGQAANSVVSFPHSFGNLSPGTVVFYRREIRIVPVMSPRLALSTRDQGSQADSQPCTLASTNTQTDEATSHSAITEEEEEECSRDELIKINLKQNLIYISHCIKPDDLILHLHCFSEEQKSDIQAEKNLIKASRKALEMLLQDVTGLGRFVALRDALHENDGYPKIVRILDGEYNPEDQNYVKVVELFTLGIINRLEPAELLPFLLQKGVFKDMDVQEIKAEEKNHGQIRAACVLLMCLPRRTIDWFRCFLQALIDCKLEDIAEMLDPDIFKDISSKTNKQTDVLSCSSSNNKAKFSPSKALSKKQSNLSKIISRNATCGKQNSSQVKLNAFPLKKPGNVPFSAKEIKDPVREDSSSYSRIAATSSDGIETTLESMTVCETHTIASNANNETVLAESNGSNRNHQPRSEEHQNKLEPAILCPKNMKKYAICRMANGRRIIIMTGDLVDIRVDVMVNTTDNHLSLETGLAETISEKGGEIIKKACRTYIQSNSSIDEGDVFVSKAGDLPAKHVIHVNSPIWRGGEEKEDKILKQAVIKIMIQASLRNARTIAMPAIGCGTSGFPKKIGTKLIVRAVENFFREKPDSGLQDVYIVDIDTKVCERFTNALFTVFEDEPKCSIEKIEES